MRAEAFVWSPAKVSKLETLDGKGLSPTAIAAQLGASSAGLITRKLRALGRVSPAAAARVRRVEVVPVAVDDPAPPIIAKPAPPAIDWTEGGGEARTVFALRARKVPWPHIARQLGRNELSLRSTYEEGFDKSLVPRRASAPATASKTAARRQFLIPVLTLADNSTAEQIATKLGFTTSEVCAALNRARLNGWVEHNFKSPRRWALTSSGRAKIAASVEPV
jgi:hypothetical protein